MPDSDLEALVTQVSSTDTTLSWLVRLDERTKNLVTSFEAYKVHTDDGLKEERDELRRAIADLNARIGTRRQQDKDDLMKALKDLKDSTDNFVTKEQLHPIQSLVYGMVGIILTVVLGALVGLVVIK